MEEDQLKKIFDPFYSTKPKGSGLGLVVVHDILERHGIEYDVHSTLHEGTSFTLRFRL
jgi:signal transduction histidine kinase